MRNALSRKTCSQLLSEEQGSKLTGVSVETIRKFSEVGLISTTDLDGKTHFHEEELLAIFGQESSARKKRQDVSRSIILDRRTPRVEELEALMDTALVPECCDWEFLQRPSSGYRDLVRTLEQLRLERLGLLERIESLEKKLAATPLIEDRSSTASRILGSVGRFIRRIIPA